MRWITTLIAVVIAATVGIVIVMQKLALTRVGYEVGQVEREHVMLSEDLRRLDSEVDRRSSLQVITEKVKELGLPLVPPGEEQS